MIRITCYDKVEQVQEQDRMKMMKFYEDCIYASEGCERDRYVSIFFALINGKNDCDDMWKWKFGEEM